MIKIESLKDYLETISNEEFIRLATKIYMITDFICKDYPKHKEWYFTKQLPAIVGEERNILFVRNPENQEEIISMTCLKRDEEEQKICTLYVSDKCRGLGIGTAIVEDSMKWLGTTKPLITLADYKLEIFKSIIDKYDWQLTEIISGLYNDRSQELCFNGTLTKNNKNPLEQQLHRRLIKALEYRKNQLK
ncbi:MAG: GNAT family N-acetyltransferase [bacterium]|nr:GNAT family N-acetyltransferase [bacterium]